MNPVIRPATHADLPVVVDITNHYIKNTVIHFATQPWTVEEARAEFDAGGTLLPFLVAESGGDVVGFARASKWKSRCAYDWAVETGIYLRPDACGQGLGRALYNPLFDVLKKQGYRTIISGIALPNPASVRLHESMGMKHIGTFPRVGYKCERWIDVGYWTLEFGAPDPPPRPRPFELAWPTQK